MTDQAPISTALQPLRLRLDDYLLLDRAGAFDAYARTELLDGELFFMNAQHRPHAFLKTELAYRLRRALEDLNSPLYALVEASIAVPDASAPEPDIVVTDDPRGEGLVPLASVRLVVEVADATLGSDLSRKVALYAAAGIAEYWVADVGGRAVHQHWRPEGAVFAERRVAALGEPLAAATLPGLAIDTAGL